MSDYLVRGMTMDGFVKAVAIRSTEMVNRGVHIEDKDAAGVQGLVDAPDGLFAIGRVCDVVQAVQRAHRQVNAPGQLQLLEQLAGKD